MLVRLALRGSAIAHRSYYATIAHDHWPQSRAQKSLTPYQILNANPRAPYSKEHFTELVKLYHPDKSAHPSICSHLTEAVRLERYRLIVAAHGILSDPVRREAYDTSGAGWINGTGGSFTSDIPPYRQRDPGGKGAWSNATWEDWEQYYSKQAQSDPSRKQQQTTFVSNNNIVTVFIVLAFMGGAAQFVHAENMTAANIAFRDERHFQAVRDLEKTKEAARNHTRESRIEQFVRQRDAAVLTDDGLSALVMKPDICDSGDAVGRSDKELDMRRKWESRRK